MVKYAAVLLLIISLVYSETIFTDNMTNFPDGWLLYGTSLQHWTKSNARRFSMEYSAKSTPLTSYSNGVDVSMERSINLSGYSAARLKFYAWTRTELNDDYVQCQYYDAMNWTTVWSRSGSFQSWQRISVDVPTSATKIRFRFYSNQSTAYEGAYIDDVVLEATPTTLITKEWTIMVYLNADNNLESYGIQDFNEMEAGGGSNDDRNVIVQIDRAEGYDTTNGNWTSARRYYVNTDSTPIEIKSTLVQDLGEIDMGSPQTLANFAKWTVDNYPADKYLLVLWDHGDGWYREEGTESNLFRGFSGDMSSGNSIELSNGELANALSQIKVRLGRNIDLIGWDACLMGMWEVMDICKNYANILVSSEEVETGEGWYYSGFLNSLNGNPAMPSVELGQAVVYGTPNQFTLDVVDLSQVPNLSSRIDSFARELIKASDSGAGQSIQGVRSMAKEFYINFHIDLYDLCDKIVQSNISPSVNNAAINLENAILSTVRLYQNSSAYSMCRGIAIYYPTSPSSYDARYNNLSITSTYWDEFIKGLNGYDYIVAPTTYAWISTSTPSGIINDEQSVNFRLPFSFVFYGRPYNSINICSNGFLSFTSASTSALPKPIPHIAEPNCLLAPLWRDLNPVEGGTITYYSGSDKFVATWDRVKNYANNNIQSFQVILYPDGNIVYQYRSVTNDITTSRGIENHSGTAGQTIGNPTNLTAWRFAPCYMNRSSPRFNHCNIRGQNATESDTLIIYGSVVSVGRSSFVYRIRENSPVNLKIYNSLGQVVATVINSEQVPGIYSGEWIPGNIPKGIYFYHFQTKTVFVKGKLMLVN
jgi:hypothetical protein